MASAAADATVHVVDDDGAVRESICFLLDTDGIVCRSYDSAEAMLSRGANFERGCIVSDVRMPGMNGLELIGEVKRRGLTHPVIVLTGHADVAMAVDAMKAGAFDFIEKPFQDGALLNAIRKALVAEATKEALGADLAELTNRVAQLTAREREVFHAIVEGDSNKAAALRLGISPRTVEIYRANVMTKMQAQSLSELVRIALRIERG
jgi:two-component system response regulator FixJ